MRYATKLRTGRRGRHGGTAGVSGYIQAVIDFISQHPHWAGILVFLTAATEAIAVIGALIPGTTILVGVGAIVGLGHLPLWPILIWATLGAIAGDGVSYWLGHRYGRHVAQIWPFSRRPELLGQGEAFFGRHGAKSVVLGRFLPMTRAVVPLVAGTLGMNPLRFYIANVLSAIAWAPLHILPGVLLGGMLTVLSGISGRLVAVLVGVLLLAAAVAWLLRLAVLQIAPLIARLQIAAFAWASNRSGLLARTAASALDPADPGARTVLLLGTLGAVCGIGFLNILEDIIEKDSLVQADQAISNFVQGLRTAWADHAMVVVTMLGDGVVTLPVAVAAAGWLAWRRQWRLAAGFALTIVLARASVILLKAVLQQPRPIDIYVGAETFSFPSGHATMAAVLYGTLAWLVATALSPRGRVAALAIAGAVVGLMAASRIYLAAHWPSDVGAGITLGFTLAAVFALVFRRTAETHRPLTGLLPVVLVTLTGVGGWHLWQGFDANLERYARQQQVSAIAAAEWRAGGWQRLPQRRIDLGGETEEAFVLQWAGTPEALGAWLQTAGWTPPAAWSLESAAGFATAAATPATLPALPLLHDGHTPALTLVAPVRGGVPTPGGVPASGGVPAPGAEERRLLRAWPSGFAAEGPEGQRPILLVSLMHERIVHPWGLASIPIDDAITGAPAQALLTAALARGTASASAAAGATWSSPKPGLVIAGPTAP